MTYLFWILTLCFVVPPIAFMFTLCLSFWAQVFVQTTRWFRKS